ncbi:SPFH domain-containing protein [Hymenobacter terrestris]|uniref:Band 7 domain-containing protein n=1 Tax=Hymenobacter terrestris TaxID=2748310 RepID=A0ABX2Q0F8_9BACT|nr:SPFH domain-containing protein [Hymenobacter terrestris]NVO83891.1 hypothetical protein [Hymenobacter terrestris]
MSTIVQVDAGEVGVQTLFGQVQTRALLSGLSVMNPLVDIARFDTKIQKYNMSAFQSEGQQGNCSFAQRQSHHHGGSKGT